MSSQLSKLDLSQKTFRRIYYNYAWSLTYNLLMCRLQRQCSTLLSISSCLLGSAIILLRQMPNNDVHLCRDLKFISPLSTTTGKKVCFPIRHACRCHTMQHATSRKLQVGQWRSLLYQLRARPCCCAATSGPPLCSNHVQRFWSPRSSSFCSDKRFDDSRGSSWEFCDDNWACMCPLSPVQTAKG